MLGARGREKRRDNGRRHPRAHGSTKGVKEGKNAARARPRRSRARLARRRARERAPPAAEPPASRSGAARPPQRGPRAGVCLSARPRSPPPTPGLLDLPPSAPRARAAPNVRSSSGSIAERLAHRPSRSTRPLLGFVRDPELARPFASRRPKRAWTPSSALVRSRRSVLHLPRAPLSLARRCFVLPTAHPRRARSSADAERPVVRARARGVCAPRRRARMPVCAGRAPERARRFSPGAPGARSWSSPGVARGVDGPYLRSASCLLACKGYAGAASVRCGVALVAASPSRVSDGAFSAGSARGVRLRWRVERRGDPGCDFPRRGPRGRWLHGEQQRLLRRC